MRAGRRGITLLAALLTLTGCATTLPAQEAGEAEEAARRSCRCVDRAGEEIESCVCVVTPDVSRIVAVATSLRRAHLGVGFDWTQERGIDRQGVRVERVASGSPAAEAGLRAGDILVSVAGRHLLNPLPDADQEDALDEHRSLPVQRLLVLAGELEPGEAVQVRYLRDGRERATTVVPEEAPFGAVARIAPRLRLRGDSLRLRGESLRLRGDSMRLRGDSLRVLGDSLRARLWREGGAGGREARARRHRALTREHEARARNLALRFQGPRGAVVARAPFTGLWRPFGLELVELNPDLAGYFEVDGGVLVADVAEGSELGLRPGDVILAVGERGVEDVSDIRRILSSFEPDEEIRFRIVRRGDERTVTGHLDGREHPNGF